jgi:hypothetical protein
MRAGLIAAFSTGALTLGGFAAMSESQCQWPTDSGSALPMVPLA